MYIWFCYIHISLPAYIYIFICRERDVYITKPYIHEYIIIQRERDVYVYIYIYI